MSYLPYKIPEKIQKLSPQSAKLCLKVRDFMNLELGKKINNCIVACSGGADSLSLALILYYLNIKFKLVHLNHNLRDSSQEEADFVNNFAHLLNVNCYTKHENIKAYAKNNKIGLEEAGRAARYAFFNEVLKETKYEYVATAHHLGDLSEDILLRLIRGTGWPSLGGMSAYDENRRIIRPLLGISRREIEEFLRSLNIIWVDDESNEDLSYTRNRIRHILLPLVELENPSFQDTAYNLWTQAAIDTEFFKLQLANIKPSADNFLDREKLESLSRALRLRTFYNIIKMFNIQANFKTILKLDKAYLKKHSNTVFKFKNLEIHLKKEGLYFKILQA